MLFYSFGDILQRKIKSLKLALVNGIWLLLRLMAKDIFVPSNI